MIALLPGAVALSLIMCLAWLWQRRTQNAGWVDTFWTLGLGGVGAAVALAAGSGPRRLVVAVLVAAWSLRLGLYLWVRTRRAPEDTRYAQFRRDWGARFEPRLFGFLQIQAAAATLLLVPISQAAASPRPLGWPDALAALILAAAIAGEALADAQLLAFRRQPGSHGKICTTGLWGLSRHPNYFFEWLHWLAYPVLAIGAPHGWAALIGPAFMYWLLVHVSGIPPLEAQMLRSRGEAYRAYQRRVRAFIPWPKGDTA